MTTTDVYLYEVAKAMNGESYKTANYLAVGTTVVTSIDTDDTALLGEIGGRKEFTGSRTLNVDTITAIRTAVSVQDNINGDIIKSSGCFNTITQSTDDNLLLGVTHSGITQTTNFDLEFEYQITFDRG